VERRREVISQLKDVILDMPYLLCTIIVCLSLYRNVEIYRYYRSEKKKLLFRPFILYQLVQLIYDIPLVFVALVSCVLVPYRVYFMFKLLFYVSCQS